MTVMTESNVHLDPAPATAARRTRGLSRPAWHFLVDVMLMAALLVLICVAGLLQFIFPAPTQADGWLLWGLGYDAWSNVRFAAFAVFLAMTTLHVMLQWNWVCNFVETCVARLKGGQKQPVRKALRTVYGVAFLILLLTVLGAVLLAAELTVQNPPPS